MACDLTIISYSKVCTNHLVDGWMVLKMRLVTRVKKSISLNKNNDNE
jgi:hypothetical protein